MKEDFLHYIFENQLLENNEFQVIHPGTKNTDAGPDFFNAKIQIEDTIWAGNVEIHIKSSDWYAHKHHKDKAYDNIILHLVMQNDCDIYNSNQLLIPSYEIQFNPQLYQNYQNLLSSKQWIHCQNQVNKVEDIIKNSFVERLAIERLLRKGKQFSDLLQYNNTDWENAFYQALGRGFGGAVNSLPFELLCKSLPLKILLKHKNNLTQIEALLFGQSGLLEQIKEEEIDDNSLIYINKLKNEYAFLAKKFQLKPIRSELWKFSKIRPYNFPTIKLALFSQLIYEQQFLLSQITNAQHIKDLFEIFTLKAHSFWNNHYTFVQSTKQLPKKMGKHSIQHIIINTIIPFTYLFGKKNKKDDVLEKSLSWLEALESETNSICQQFEALGFNNQNALQSQGLIELKKEMCNKHHCIDCHLAHKILSLNWS